MSGVLPAICLPLSATAANGQIHGRIEIQDVFAHQGTDTLAAALGARNLNDTRGNLRLIWAPRWKRWSFTVHDVLAIEADDPGLEARQARIETGNEAPPANWWDLSETLVNRPHLAASQSIDRLFIGYASAHLVLRAGRQALTWGAGLVFHPLDLLDPFSPTAIDTEYKPGADMFYGQYLFASGADMEMVAVPRPARAHRWPSADASSFALRFSAAPGRLQSVWVLARDRGDWLLGARVNGSLGGATWNVELAPTFVRDGPVLTSLLANLSDGVRLLHRDTTVFVEYYHDGFGLAARGYSLNELPQPLRRRLLRQQLFDTGRDYLATGLLMQWDPLTRIEPTLIGNLDDRSAMFLVQVIRSLRENLNILFGMQLPLGPKRTEFGGLPLSAGGPLVGPPATAYLELRRYF